MTSAPSAAPRFGSNQPRRRGVLAGTALLALAAPGAAQASKPPEPPSSVDPYTRGEPERLARLGYLSLGPFLFGPETTEVVESRLGDVPILWVETEHFRLGSSLAEYRPERADEIDELKDELAGLRALFADVPAKPKKLDPWLRLHLFARRLEALHADVSARLGVLERAPDAKEPPPSGQPVLIAFGMAGKFTVLLTQKRSTLARFTREYCGAEREETCIHYFLEQGSLFYGASDDHLGGLTDSDLHYAVVYGVTQNLLNGIHGFPHDLPSWWQHGLALWFARAREPRIGLYVRPAGDQLPPDVLADWEPLVRGRVEGDAVLDWSEMLARPSWLGQPFGDNIVLWSRLDFLLRREGTVPLLAALLHQPVREPPDSAGALSRSTGLELVELDRAWREWVVKSYRKKRK
jgi:hypothetical protein